MSKKEIIISTLEDIKFSLELIVKRSQSIKSVDDFLVSEDGLEKLDSIANEIGSHWRGV